MKQSVTKIQYLGEQLNHLRHVHSAMAANATTETTIEVSWVLIDYMLWTIDHRPAPVDPYRAKTSRYDREELKTLLAMVSRDTGKLEVLLRPTLEDLERAEAKIKEAGL